jgi:hypothetical protein
MSRYTLQVIAPFAPGSQEESAAMLASALDAIATIHGGTVVDSSTHAKAAYQRQYVNITDCESSLEKEVEWLRRKFPYTRFTLKEFTAS